MTKKRQAKQITDFRPSDLMRARRPYLFSDTEVAEEARLDRSIFEYHLETLTQRKQELDFERFARKLAEKEICPNLLPQTGPTGGGDSKVDSETYPVASEISEQWYYADTNGAQGATERWAFAFSAKQKWKDKVSADIKSIADTGRGYTKTYFITSRAVKDKDRAAVEDSLSKTYGIDVRILDRTWITEKVFSNRREALAIEALKLSVPLAPSPKKGPRDTSREAELNELETQITDPERYQGLDYQLIEDALQAALLARGLELPRVEVDGRFERASRLAHDRGTQQQELRCAYQRAWTYFWWYDDFASFNGQYDVVEKLAQGSAQISDLDLLKNLWQLLYTSVEINHHIDPAEGRLSERTELLEKELARLQSEHGRPSVALHARASQLLMELTRAHAEPGQLKKVLGEFRDVFEKSQGLIDFPAQEFIKVLTELGEYFTDDEGFDDVFESLLEIARERESIAVSGRMLLRRGSQKLKGKKPYEAIRLLGRAQQDLALHESRGEMAVALGLCAYAYEIAGLLWAARGSMLLAANQALKEFWERGNITGQALVCVRRMIWIELQLGRVPCALAWIEVFLTLNSAAELDQERRKRLAEEWMHIDGTLGYLLLHTEVFDLKNLRFLPAVLEHLHLDAAWVALLHALGYEDRLRQEEAIPSDETAEGVQEFFNKWVGQPGLSDLPAPEFLDKQTVELHSNVLGCEITATLPNDNNSLFWAEAILAGLEAFLATSLQSAAPHTATLCLKIIPRDFMGDAIEWTVHAVPHTLIEVHHRRDESAEDQQEAVKDKLIELISTITAYIAMPPGDEKKFFENLIRDERGFGRALLITGVRTMVGNILGQKPKIRMSDWDSNDSSTESFPLARKQAWLPAAETTPEEMEAKTPTAGKGDPPPEMFDVERRKHRDQRVFSLININLWNKAKWTGTGYITSADPDEAPFLALLFRDPKAAAAIFQDWRDEIGKQDTAEKIRVSIITGIDRNNPAAYRVLVSTNPDWAATRKDKVDQFVIVARINEMNPKDSSNLDRFLESYNRKKQYLSVPGQPGPNGVGGWAPSLGILKNELNLRPACKSARTTRMLLEFMRTTT